MGLFSFFKKDKEAKEEGSDSSKVDGELCGGCGKCVSVCPNNSFEIVDGVSSFKEYSSCRDCKLCVAACPSDAISLN